jgi:hypothetical protein
MQDEKRQNQKKFKNPQKLVTGDFPTLGGSKKKTEPAVNWGVPGSAFPKTNKGQTKNGKKLGKNNNILEKYSLRIRNFFQL